MRDAATGALCGRSAQGRWKTIGTSPGGLVCGAALGDAVFVGTDDARVLRLQADGGLILLYRT